MLSASSQLSSIQASALAWSKVVSTLKNIRPKQQSHAGSKKVLKLNMKPGRKRAYAETRMAHRKTWSFGSIGQPFHSYNFFCVAKALSIEVFHF